MAAFIKPPLIKTGDKIMIIAPSGVVSDDYIQKATEIFESWGIEVVYGKNLFASHNQFAGTDEQRLSDIQHAIDSDEINAVICARGGYGLIRIIDKIQWKKYLKKPKWIVGFSDITVLHASLLSNAIQSIHGIMPINIGDLQIGSKPVEYLGQVLFEGAIEYNLPGNSLNRAGNEEAIITGGNLSLVFALMGTPYEINTDRKILFIEDVGEQYYHIDRMMQSMRLAGKFDELKGLIVGGLTEMVDKKRPFGKTPEEIISEIVEEYDFPIIFNFPAGHIKDNYPLILGSECVLDINIQSAKVLFK